VSEELQNSALDLFQAGKDAFERGQYRLSIEALEAARESLNLASRQGGDLQLWLVTAYQAGNRMTEAIALCRQLTQHPNPDIRKKSKDLLYILEAPRLQRPKEWMTEIPNLATPDDSKPQYVRSSERKIPQQPVIRSEDPRQINTKNNAFIGVAIGVILLSLVAMTWLSARG
jgi:tetratricopeptide (TPR) repeat protein